MAGALSMVTVQHDDNVHEPQASIATLAGQEADAHGDGGDAGAGGLAYELADAEGPVHDLLTDDELTALGRACVLEWKLDEGSRADWREIVEQALEDAAQETDEEKGYPWPDAANVRYPQLTVSAEQFAARAYPALIKGDRVAAVKPLGKTPGEVADDNRREARKVQQAAQAAQQQGSDPAHVDQAQMAAAQHLQQAQQQAQDEWDEKRARAARVETWLNHLIFEVMDDWEGDVDALLNQSPISGCGFKKVYRHTDGHTQSDFVTPLDVVVSAKTKSLRSAPRITHPFTLHPYEIEQRQRAGQFRDVHIPLDDGEDPEAPRELIEQHRLSDLGEDGVMKPLIVTVDVKTMMVLCVDAPFNRDDIVEKDGKVVRVKRWNAFVLYPFLPHPKGNLYGIGFGHLLRMIMATVDTGLNQLIDAGHAQIAGGGFVGSSLRLQDEGQTGTLYFQPGEYPVVNIRGGDIREAIWERTLPQPSEVTLKMVDVLLAAAKDITSVKDVNTGEAPSTAPVGTTLAMLEQALQVFSAIYLRYYRSLKVELRTIYECEARWGVQDEDTVAAYAELTGGDMREDFKFPSHSIMPTADPKIVTRQQALARSQTISQVAESPLGVAAGMTAPQVAQKIVRDLLSIIEVDDPDEYLGPPPPANPLDAAKTQLTEAQAGKAASDAALSRAKALREVDLAAVDRKELHVDGGRGSELEEARHPIAAPDDGQEDGGQ